MIRQGSEEPFLSWLTKVLRARQTRIDHPPPVRYLTFLDSEREIVPIGIDHDVEIVVLLRRTRERKGQTMRVMREIHIWSDSVPMHVFAPEAAAPEGWVRFSKRDHALEKSKYIPIAFQQTPIQPGRFVILVVGIVVPSLCVHELITRAEHGRAVGKKKETTEIPDLPLTERHHSIRYTLVTFPAAIPTVIVVADSSSRSCFDRMKERGRNELTLLLQFVAGGHGLLGDGDPFARLLSLAYPLDSGAPRLYSLAVPAPVRAASVTHQDQAEE